MTDELLRVLQAACDWLSANSRVTPAAAGLALVMLIAWRARRTARADTGPCRRCEAGYQLEGLPTWGRDSRQVCLRCPRCQAYYAKEITGPHVLKVDESWVRARWPEPLQG